MTVTLNLPSCFMLANIKQFATLFVFSSFLILSGESLMLCQMSSSSKSSTIWTAVPKLVASIHRSPVFTSLPNSEGRDGVVSPMQGCMFYQVSKQRARGLIFNLRREKPSGTLWVRFILPPSNSISQSSQKWRSLYLIFLHCCLFSSLLLILPIISCTVDNDRRLFGCIISMHFPLGAPITSGCPVKCCSGPQIDGRQTNFAMMCQTLFLPALYAFFFFFFLNYSLCTFN